MGAPPWSSRIFIRLIVTMVTAHWLIFPLVVPLVIVLDSCCRQIKNTNWVYLSAENAVNMSSVCFTLLCVSVSTTVLSFCGGTDIILDSWPGAPDPAPSTINLKTQQQQQKVMKRINSVFSMVKCGVPQGQVLGSWWFCINTVWITFKQLNQCRLFVWRWYWCLPLRGNKRFCVFFPGDFLSL